MFFCQRIINQYSPQSIQLNVRASFRGGMKGRKKHQEEEENKMKTDSLILPCCLFTSLCAQLLSRVWLCATPWTLACLAPLSMGFPGKNSGVGCHFLLQGSSQPRDQTHVSCVSCPGRQVLYHYASQEGLGTHFPLTYKSPGRKVLRRPVVINPMRRKSRRRLPVSREGQSTADPPAAGAFSGSSWAHGSPLRLPSVLTWSSRCGSSSSGKPGVQFWTGASAPQQQDSCWELQLHLWRDEGAGRRWSLCLTEAWRRQRQQWPQGRCQRSGRVHGTAKRPLRSRENASALCSGDRRGQVPGWRKHEPSPAVKALLCSKYSGWNGVLLSM